MQPTANTCRKSSNVNEPWRGRMSIFVLFSKRSRNFFFEIYRYVKTFTDITEANKVALFEIMNGNIIQNELMFRNHGYWSWVLCTIKFFCSGQEPWSSGYGWWLMFERLWVRILAPYTGWRFGHLFTLICCNNCIVCLEKTENKRKRGRGWAI